jgi:hypothetical protein
MDGGREQSLSFPFGARAVDDASAAALRAIERHLEICAALESRAAPLDRDRELLRGLARELRGLRDCYEAARHPRVRDALLREAGRIARRMSAVGRRAGIRGLAPLPDVDAA